MFLSDIILVINTFIINKHRELFYEYGQNGRNDG